MAASAAEMNRVQPVWAMRLCAAAFCAILGVPLAFRLAHVSLYGDDVVRIAQLQTTPLSQLLFRPFNEHMAPLFEVVSWTTWQIAGHRLTLAPIAFTLAAFVPFLLSLLLLHALVMWEMKSQVTALGAMALFGLATVSIETVWWYSASSFQWALAATLAMALCESRAATEENAFRLAAWWTGSLLAAAAAPAFSAIGMLSGPFGALFALTRPGRTQKRLAAVPPLAGTALYFAICSAFHYDAIVTDSVERHADLWAAIWGATRAPLEVLLPNLLGSPGGNFRLPLGYEQPVFLIAATAMLISCRLSTKRHWIWGGLALVVGGYGIIFAFRGGTSKLDDVIRVQRYHLFPLLGVVLILAAAIQRWAARYEMRPIHELGLATTFAGLLLIAHLPQMQTRVLGYHFPDQHRTLAALERLAFLCQRERITRQQALAALDPIRTRWFDHPYNALKLIRPCAATPGIRDAEVRARILAALELDDREALCGGMDATRYFTSLAARVSAAPVSVGRQVKARGVQSRGRSGQYLVGRGPAYLEFELTGDRTLRSTARALSVPGDWHGQEIEVWWTDRSRRWSETRSVRWGPLSREAASTPAVPLDCLPHWDPAHAERVRLVFRTPGRVEVQAPRLLR